METTVITGTSRMQQASDEVLCIGAFKDHYEKRSQVQARY